MSWRTKRLNLTKEQKERGVIFSSVLIVTNEPITPTLHEVLATDPRKDEKISNLKDVDFFKGFAKTAGYDVIHEIRR